MCSIFGFRFSQANGYPRQGVLCLMYAGMRLKRIACMHAAHMCQYTHGPAKRDIQGIPHVGT